MNRLLFKNGILNIRKRLEITKVRQHRHKCKDNQGRASKGSEIRVTEASANVYA